MKQTLITILFIGAISTISGTALSQDFFQLNPQYSKHYSKSGIDLRFNPNHYSLDKDAITLLIRDKELFELKNTRPSYFSNSNFSLKTKNHFGLDWKLVENLSVNFNVFEDSINFFDTNLETSPYPSMALKSFAPTRSFQSTNRQISGFKLGVSSELGLGKSLKLGLNFDIGKLEGADILGFNNPEVNTTSFGIGIRNSNFGASVNTDLYLEDMIPNLNQSRLGFEFDWHFSSNSKLSLGTKTSIDPAQKVQSSIDEFTGDVQYIKFQHNL